MPRRALAPFALAVGLTGLLLSPPDDDVHVAARASALYLEDAPAQRPIAAVEAWLLVGADGARVEVELSALGDGVVPPPGIEGVSGSNARTARELGRLLRADALRLVTRVDGASRPGEPPRTFAGGVPTRRWREDGGIGPAPARRFDAVRVRLRSAPLPDGTSFSYVEADGMPRLRVEVRRERGAASIRLASLPEEMPDPAGTPGANASEVQR